MLNWIRDYFKRTEPAELAERSFIGAKVNRFNQDFLMEAIRTNEDIRRNLPSLRNRSRELSKNNGDYRKYLRMCERNIVGPNGILLQTIVRLKNGKLDKMANQWIVKRWADFCMKGNCTANRRQGMRRLMKNIVRCWRIDGEVFLRRLPNFNNRHRYAFQLLDPAACPVTLNQVLPNGNRIVMGVELDPWDAPVAYYFYSRSNVDSSMGSYYDPIYAPTQRIDGEAYVRLPVEEINHFYDDELVGQVRGFPFGQAAMQEIYLLNSYVYAELVAADAASKKLGKIVNKKLPSQYGGRNADGTQKEAPIQRVKTEAGSFDLLTGDWDILTYDPQHPAANFPPFIKAMNRKVANGLDVAYNGFANDLESVNFSSMRGGVLDERDAWMDQQQTIIEDILDVEFPLWLQVQLLLPDSPYEPFAFERLNAAQWLPRRWSWVDPERDAQSKLSQVALGATTPQDIAAELGNNFDDNIEQIKEAVSALGPIREYLSIIKDLKGVFDKSQNLKPDNVIPPKNDENDDADQK